MAQATTALAEKLPVVAIRDLHKSFGELDVLKGISFSAREGEVVSLIGCAMTQKTLDRM